MEKAMKQYSCWLEENLPQDLREELEMIRGDQDEIYERFCRDMTFGTSGLRGIMGAGTSRINSVVLKRATRGLADDLLQMRKIEENMPALALSYDTRVYSEGYGSDVAETLSACGIDTWIVDSPQPVPLLSFAIRAMGLDGGIMITASHNPKEFNGYKVYDREGNQIGDETARRIERRIADHDYFESFAPCERVGRVRPIPKEVIEAYRSAISERAVWWKEDPSSCRAAMSALSVVYTPLNGTGYGHVTEIFRRLGIGRLAVVESQIEGDGSFRTCPSPNPENRETFYEAERLAYGIIEEGQSPPDLIIATDPDSDRMGVMVWQPGQSEGSEQPGRSGQSEHPGTPGTPEVPGTPETLGRSASGSYLLLSGNQAGALIFDYLCQSLSGPDGRQLKGKKLFKSLVSSPFLDAMAKAHGIEVENTLTGFKNIAQKIGQLCCDGREEEFLFGFEESLGYLYGTYTRDKDGVMASQLIVLAAARCKETGMTLVDRLRELHREYGYMESRAWSLYFEKERDRQRMETIMGDLFGGQMKEVQGLPVEIDRTYEKERVFQGSLEDGWRHRFIIRPSGTELKLKAYVFAGGSEAEDAAAWAEKIMSELKSWLIHKKEEIRIE